MGSLPEGQLSLRDLLSARQGVNNESLIAGLTVIMISAILVILCAHEHFHVIVGAVSASETAHVSTVQSIPPWLEYRKAVVEQPVWQV